MRYFVSIAAICLLFLMVPISLGENSGKYYSEEELMENIEEAGENSDDILEVLQTIEDPEVKEAYSFLLAYMPAVDLVALDPDKFLKEVEAAVSSRKNLPWGDESPKEIFYNFVLPHRSSQEPLEYWRVYLQEKLAPVLDTIDNAYDAAIAVNKWCGERVVFRRTQRQDQGVFETLKSGYGRCEEMAIIYVCACRAAGIPARSAWTPYWTHSDNNHAWVEVFVDGDWHYTGGCEPKPKLNDAWFNKSVKRAPVVMTACYGKPLLKENIYKKRDKFAILYSTENYDINPGEIKVTCPEESLDVNISIYNWGALRPIQQHYTDSLGKAAFELNEGDYYVSAGDSVNYVSKIVHVRPGEATEVELIPKPRKYTKREFKMIYR